MNRQEYWKLQDEYKRAQAIKKLNQLRDQAAVQGKEPGISKRPVMPKRALRMMPDSYIICRAIDPNTGKLRIGNSYKDVVDEYNRRDEEYGLGDSRIQLVTKRDALGKGTVSPTQSGSTPSK